MSRLGFFLSEAWEIQSRDRANAWASLTALTAVLFLLAVVLLAGFNIRGLAHNLEGRKGLQVFLVDDISPERVSELTQTIQDFGEVAEVLYVTKEEALADLEEELGGIDAVGALGENPLSACLAVRLTPEAASRPGVVQDLARGIERYDGVDEVVFGGDWIAALDRGLRNVYWATAGAGFLAAVSVLLVLWNTLKLAFLSRRDAIRILKLVGATPSFIRFPYVLLGAGHASVAALLALALSGLVYLSLAQMMPGIQFLSIGCIVLFLLGAACLGTISGVASVGPALRHLERSHEVVTR